MDETLLKWILGVNAGSLIALITFGYKAIRIFNRMEMKVELMWSDYEERKMISSE